MNFKSQKFKLKVKKFYILAYTSFLVSLILSATGGCSSQQSIEDPELAHLDPSLRESVKKARQHFKKACLEKVRENRQKPYFNSSVLIASTPMGGQMLTPDEIYAKVSPAVAHIKTFKGDGSGGINLLKGQASGIILTSDGFVLTNEHVVRKKPTETVEPTVLVTLKDGREFTSKVLDRDSLFDLALVKLDNASGLPFATWASYDVKEAKRLHLTELNFIVSKPVYAIGFPAGEPWKMTSGDVTAMYGGSIPPHETPKNQFITQPGLVSPGYSGGPLINSHGQVIGITSRKHQKAGGGSHISVLTVKGFIDEVIPVLRRIDGIDEQFCSRFD